MRKASIGFGILVVGIGGLFFTQPFRKKDSSPPPVQSAASSDQQSIPEMTAPARFIVPSLNLSSPVTAVGLTSSGDMDTPTNDSSVGWYKKGAEPGDIGSATLAAHAGPPDQPSPFKSLESIKKGARFEIEDIRKSKAIFIITEIATYTPETAPLERIFGKTSQRRLVFITCTGEWNSTLATYSHRLVIYATRNS